MRIITLTFLLFVYSAISAQTETKIDPENFNFNYLEGLVIAKINHIRLEHNCEPLKTDSALYKAAKHHTNYMAENKVLSHFESKNKAMRTPQKRTEFFNAEGYGLGENILYNIYNSNVTGYKNALFKTYTYEVLADAILDSWLTSPGHFQNIIMPAYSTTGLAISIDKTTKRVYVCQDFMKIR